MNTHHHTRTGRSSVEIAMSQLTEREKYRLLTSCIVPRPIAWVSTMDRNGILNAAPFSFFTGVSIEPPIILLAVERRRGRKKDTLVNIEDTGEFVVNVVTEQTVQAMNETSQDFMPEEDEFALAGLTPMPSVHVKVPAIQESPIHLECVLRQIHEIGSSPHALILGEVVGVRIQDDVLADGRIDMEKLKAVGRMGGKMYTQASARMFSLDRLDWRKTEV